MKEVNLSYMPDCSIKELLKPKVEKLVLPPLPESPVIKEHPKTTQAKLILPPLIP
jgi:hypothetical protein